jgi:hypothetical protein
VKKSRRTSPKPKRNPNPWWKDLVLVELKPLLGAMLVGSKEPKLTMHLANRRGKSRVPELMKRLMGKAMVRS